MSTTTAAVAEAVAEGLRASVDVEVVDAGDPSRPGVDEEVDLLVVGGPTQAFLVTRPARRDEPPRRDVTPDSPRRGLPDWLADLAPRQCRPKVAAFDTRVTRMRRVPGTTARVAAHTLRAARGYALLAAPVSFYVDDVQGPVATGELDRARAWGRNLAAVVTSSGATSAAAR